ncbi:MAG: hypothetical protein QW331_04180, partial [Candidatus Woesearchaeota archaeon]
MNILTIILFFIYALGLGFTIKSIFRIKTKDFYESVIMNIGFGIAILALLTAILPLIRISLDWKIIFVLSVAY